MAEATYTKDPPRRVPPNKVEAGRRTGDILSETESNFDTLKLEHVRKPRRFFRLGRVFAMRWIEPRSDHQRVQSPSDPRISEPPAFSEVRRFIVIHESYHASLCVPIHTYGGRGVLKPDLRIEDHARIYCFDSKPPATKINVPLREPIGIVIEGNSELQRLHPASVANFGKIYTVEHDVRVANIGFVHRSHSHRLQLNWKTPSQLGAFPSHQKRPGTPPNLSPKRQKTFHHDITDGLNCRKDLKKYKNRTPLSWAAQDGRTADIVKLLLQTGTTVNEVDWGGRTPLSRASENSHEAVARLLIEKGADINARDKDGSTPLLRASEKGHEAMARLLIEKGADINTSDKGGSTPLLRASEKGHEAVARFLINKGADINASDKGGWTPLLLASWDDHKAVARLLLEKGVEVNLD